MKPLSIVFKNHNIRLSLSYDTLTVYMPRYPYLFISELQRQRSFHRVVFSDNYGHDLYHDKQNPDEVSPFHMHFKYKTPIDETKLSELLDILVKHKGITQEQKQEFLDAFNKRYTDAISALNNYLSINVENHAKEIVTYIKTIGDNDILMRLHFYLSSESKFDHLHEIDKTSVDKWQSVNAQGDIIQVSESWAMIEKAFSLQLTHNLQKNCGNFTPEFAKEYGDQLVANAQFFPLKRKFKENEEPKRANKLRVVFSEANQSELNRIYEKHFKL